MSSAPQLSPTQNYKEKRRFEAGLAAYEVLRRMVCERPPFERWRPEEHLFSTGLDDDFQLALSAYSLSVYLQILKEKLGLPAAEKTRAHILVLSSFDETIESRLPIFLEAVRNASIYGDKVFGDSISDPEARAFWSLAAFISSAAGWLQHPQTTFSESPLLKALVKCLVVASATTRDLLGVELDNTINSGGTHRWSAQPGPFERQLQRQQGNPLFLAEQRKISPSQIQEAWIADLRKAFVFLGEFRPFIQEMFSMKRQTAFDKFLASWKKAIDLTVSCAWLGPYFSAEMKKLEAVAAAIEKGLSETIRAGRLVAPGLMESLKDYKALAGIQRGVPLAIAETIKDLGIDSNELWLRSVLSEDGAAIWALGAYTNITRFDGWQRVQEVVDAAIQDGLPADVAKRKLNAYRDGKEGSNNFPGFETNEITQLKDFMGRFA